MIDDRRFWLVKTEPECFSIGDLASSPRQMTYWDGVRNYQARNYMHDMRAGDRVLFYHSSIEPPSVVGIVTVVHEAYPDSTAWDPNEQHYDPKATPQNPIWSMVDLQLVESFPQPIPLDTLRGIPALAKMELLRKGSRLSIQTVTEQEYETVVRLARAKKPSAAKASSAKSNLTRSVAEKPRSTKKPGSTKKPVLTKGSMSMAKTKQKVAVHAASAASKGGAVATKRRPVKTVKKPLRKPAPR